MILRRLRNSQETKSNRKLSVQEKRRRLRHEILEERRLLAFGPQLLGIDHNNGTLILDNSIHNTAPRELTFRFDEGQVLNTSTLAAGIRLERSGGDGVFDNGNDLVINPSFLNLGQTSYIVLMRFAETLPDDMYRVQIFGIGPNRLTNANGIAFGDTTDDNVNNGVNFSLKFDLQLGTQAISVVPQPVTRDANGNLVQAKDKVEVYFGGDRLSTATATNPAFYRLIDTQTKAQRFPQSVTYDAALNKAVLNFGLDLSTATYHLQIGETEESNGTASQATDLGTVAQQSRASVYASPVALDMNGNPIATPIPDNGTVISAISVTDSFLVQDVNVELDIDHSWGPDLRVFLTGPAGQRVELVRDLGRDVLGGQIYGVKFEDLNNNGQKDAGEPGLPGWTVFIDTNANGELDAGERSTVTDAQGRYSFVNLPVGQSYQIVQVPQTLWRSTSPGSSSPVTMYSTDFSNGATQTLQMTGSPSSGTFTLGFSGRTTTAITYGSAATTATNIRDALAQILDRDIVVNVTAVTATEYTINFSIRGTGASVDHPAITVIDNQLNTGVIRLFNTGDASGFTSSGPLNFWHLSTGRGNEVGHSPNFSFYFGENETDVGGGAYRSLSNGTLRSPEIDLTSLSAEGPLTLKLNHRLTTESGFDFAAIRVVTNGQSTTLLNTSTNTNGFQPVQFDLSPFAGGRIQLEFAFTSDSSINLDGWYIDDIRVESRAASRTVTLGTGPLQAIAKDIDFGSVKATSTNADAHGYRAYSVTTNFEDITATGTRILQSLGGAGSITQLGGTGDDIVRGMVRDAAGNLYIAGQFQGTVDFDPTAGTTNLVSDGGDDAFVAKFNSSGALVWARRAGGLSGDSATDIAIDNAGNLVVSGSYSQTANFGGSNLTSAGATDGFIWKLNNNGNTIFVRGVGGAEADTVNGVSVSTTGEIAATGSFTGVADLDPAATVINFTSVGLTDAFVLRMTSAGGLTWVRQMGDVGSDSGEDVQFTSAGNVVTTGYFSGTVDFNPAAAVNNLVSLGGTDGFVLQLNGAGNFAWAQRFGAAATNDQGNDVTSDATGSVYFTGVSNGNILVQRHSNTGTQTWTRSFGGSAVDRGESIHVGTGGTVTVGGSFRATTNFGSGNVISAGGADGVVLRLSSTGGFISAKTFGSTLDESANAVILESASSLLMAGNFRGSTTFDLGTSTPTLTSAGGSDAFFARTVVTAGVDDAAVQLTSAQLSGFQFNFYGTLYDNLYVSSNGLITFAAPNTSGANTNLLNPPAEATIAAFWEDLLTGAADSEAVFWQLVGTGNDQRLIIQWSNVMLDNPNAAAVGPLDFQAILSERDGSIQMNYRNIAPPQIIAAGPERSVGTFTRGSQVTPDIAADSAGNYVAVWNSPNQDGDGSGIFGRRFNAAGVALGNEFQINDTTVGSQSLPRIAMNAAGRFVVTWNGSGVGDADGVFAKIFDPAGNEVTNEFLVNATTTNIQTNGFPGIDTAGNVTIVWNSQVPDVNLGTTNDVIVRRFNSTGQPLGVVDEIQRLRFAAAPAVGSQFTLSHSGQTTGVMTVAAAAATTAQNIQSGLRALPTLDDSLLVVALPTANETQTIDFTGTPTGGTFQLEFAGSVTAPITYAGTGAANAALTLANIQAALVALPNIGAAANVAVASVTDVQFTVVFQGTLGGIDQPLMTLYSNALLPTTASANITETVAGSTSGQDFDVLFSGIDGSQNQPLLVHVLKTGGVSHLSVAARREGANGELRVNNTQTSNQDNPRLDVSPAGGFTITWSSNLQDGSSSGVYAKHFDASGRAVDVDEVQRMTINGPPNAGSTFTLRLGPGTAVTGNIVYAGANGGSVTAANIQAAMRAVTAPTFREVVVTPAPGASDEVQLLTFTGNPTAGTFRLAHRGLITPAITFAGTAVADAATTATNIQTALRALTTPANTITVTPTQVNGANNPFQYVISWAGAGTGEAGVDHPLMELVANNLTQGTAGFTAVEDGGKSPNQFVISYSGLSGRANQPAITLNTGVGVSSITVEEAVNGRSAELRVNSVTADSQQAGDVVRRADGSTFYVWQSNLQDGDSFGIYGKLIDASGNLLRDEFLINTFTQASQNTPRVAADAAGNMVVTWVSANQDGSGNGVYARRLGADGFPIGDEFQVHTLTAGNQSTPSVVVNSNGTFVIAWSSAAGGAGIRAQRYTAAGARVGGETQLTQFGVKGQTRVQVARSSNGNYAVVWADANRDDDASTGIYAQIFNSNNVALSPEFQVNSTFLLAQTLPSIDMDDAGRLTVAWVSQEPGPNNTTLAAVRGRRFASNGMELGTEFLVSAAQPQATLSAVDVDVHPVTGAFVVVWNSEENFDTITLRGRTYAADGTATSAIVDLQTQIFGFAIGPRVALHSNGEFFVAWESADSASFNSNVDARIFNADGTPKIPKFQVNEGSVDAAVDDLDPDVGIDGTGVVTVVWNRVAATSDIVIRRFNLSGTALTGETLASQTTNSNSPRISVAPDGSFIVSWNDTTSTPSGSVVQRFGSDGSPLSNNFSLNDNASPDVAAANDGLFLLASLDGGNSVVVQTFQSDSATVGIKAAGTQVPGGNVLPIWVNGARTQLVGSNRSLRIERILPAAGRLFGLRESTNELLELSSVSGTLVKSSPLPAASGANAGLAYAAGTVYYAPSSGTQLFELDPDTGGTVDSLSLTGIASGGVQGLAYLAGEVVVLDGTGKLIFIDPYRNLATRTVTPATAVSRGLAGGGQRGSLFAIDAASAIVEINATTGAVLRTISSPGTNLVGLAIVDEVLLASDNAGVTYRIDLTSGAVLGTLAVPAGLVGLGADDGDFAAARGGNYQPMVDTLLDDEASLPIAAGVGSYTGRFVPVQSLGVFDGSAAQGSWRLEVQDTAAANTGVLHGWRLLFNEPDQIAPDARHFGFIGNAVDSTAPLANDVDVYRVALTSGGTLRVDALPSPGLNLMIRLFDGTGAEVARVDANSAGQGERLTYTAAAAGLFFVGISSSGNGAYNVVNGSGTAGGSTTGGYQLDVRFSAPFAVDDNNSSFDTATVIGGIGVDAQVIHSDIRSPQFTLDMPGGLDEPGHRHIQPETHLSGSAAGAHVQGQLILRFKDGVTPQRQSQILSQFNLTKSKEFGFIKALLVKTTANANAIDLVSELEQLPEIEYADIDGLNTTQLRPDDTRFPEQWHYDNRGQSGGTVDADIDLPEAWDTFTGSNQTVIAILDSGVDYNHPDLAANMWRNPGEIAGDNIDNDLNGYVDDVFGIDPGENDADPMDNDGHGTHVAGTTSAVGNNGQGVTGVNWNAKIMALKVGNASGGIPDSAVIEALNYLITMKTVYGVNVVVSNNSYGGASFAAATRAAIAASIDAGVPFVAAAGNFSFNNDVTPFYPASYDLDGIISVAASTHTDQMATFSHFGLNSVDLAAPGENILSTTLGGGTGLNSGTSMASPHVAGVVGLLAGFRPGATVSQLKSAIMLGADPLPGMSGTTVTGGRLNAAKSLSLIGITPAGLSSSAVTTAAYNFQSIIGVLPSGAPAVNSITETQKVRAREIFEVYSQLLGIQFIETANEGLTVATADLRAIDPTTPSGPGGVAGISEGSLTARVIMDAGENWGASEYGGSWYAVAMHEIGHSLGLGHAYDLPNVTVMGGFGTGEPVFPGDHDIVHARFLHKPASIDQDLYKFTLPQDGVLKAETIAERIAPNASLLDTVISIYRETGINKRELVARNDDYYSNDSFLNLRLARGTYFIGVSAAGNKGQDPTIADTGFGGTSQGDYELKLQFQPDMVSTLLDTEGVAFDGDADGTPGGRFNFYFESGYTTFVDRLADTTAGVDGIGTLASPLDTISAATERARSTLVMPRDGAAQVKDGESIVITDPQNRVLRFEFDSDGVVTGGSSPIPFTSGMSGGALAASITAAINAARTANPIQLNVTAVDQADSVRVNGSVTIDASGSSSLMGSPNIIRIVGNGGIDSDANTLADNRPYLLGTSLGTALRDGAGLIVPQGVTVMLDAGVLFKLREANIDVGTSTQGIDRSQGAVQVLGTPNTMVSFYSYRNDAVGGDSDGPGAGSSSGDWGGLVFRQDSDQEDRGVFLNWVNNAVLDSGGGRLVVNSVEDTFAPVHTVGARPSITNNIIRKSASSAISSDPASFADDGGRIGPDVHNNLIVENSINGLFVRIRTELGATIDKIFVPSRWDDLDVVHVLTENLLISSTPGGPQKDPLTGTIRARQDGRLAIDPGIIVKSEGARIETELGAQLIAEGTKALPIIFTTLSSDDYGGSGAYDTKSDANATVKSPGQWGGLYFGAMAQGSLDYVTLEYAGGLVPIEGGFDRFNALEIRQADVRLTNSYIANNASGATASNRNGRGSNTAATVFVLGAQPIIVNNLFQNNQGTVIHINANSLQHVNNSDYGRTTGPLGRFERFDDNYGPMVRLNRLQNNSFNGMEVRGGVLTTETAWDDVDIAHILRGEIQVQNHHTFSGLHLLSSDSASLVVKLAGATAGFTVNGTLLDIDDRIGGSIYIGSRGLPVVLTSLADDTAIAGVDLRGLPLGDTDNNGPSTGRPGDWRSVLLDRFSNDRNVDLLREREPTFSGGADINRLPKDAQFLGSLAPDEKSGDVDRRLGFEVHGNISTDNTKDVDVYSFSGVAGTEVYIDLDLTGAGLDSLVELVDAAGSVIARSQDNSIQGLSGTAVPLIKMTYLGGDFYTINPRDASMRVLLPGIPGATNVYFLRVRSMTPAAEIDNLNAGLTRGEYKLQIRLRQVDEKPGSFIRNADIRFASTGIQVIGLPGHSPLIGESVETRAGNEDLGSAQPLGNVLVSDRNTLSVGGNISSPTDVDWYRFELDYDKIQSIAGFNNGGKTFAMLFDIDYADGLGRPDTVLSVFDAAGNLVMVSRNSNVADDQPGVGQGSDTDDLSRGSFGTLDSFIGSAHFPAGVPGSTTTYYVAVSSNSQLPTALNGTFTAGASTTLVRLEPVNSLTRIAEDHIGFQGYTSGNFNFPVPVPPKTQLFDVSDAIPLATNVIPFQLKDVVLYTASPGTNGLKTINPFTGNAWTNVGNLPTNNPARFLGELSMRSDGRLFMVEGLGGQPGQNTAGQLVELDPSNGAVISTGTDAIPDFDPNTNPPNIQQLTTNNLDGLAWRRTDVAVYDLFYSVRGARRFPIPNATNSSTLYRADPANGSAAVVDGQPWGRVGEIFQNNPGDLGVTTGITFVGNQMFGVSDLGFFYQINAGSGRASNVVNLGRSFTALSIGPPNVENGRFASMLFALDNTGTIIAVNTAGTIQSVFQSGTTLATGNAANAGLAFSVADFNLWHPTMQRRADAGHGINAAFDNSRTPAAITVGVGSNSDLRASNESEGGLSFRFGFEQWVQNPVAGNAYIRYGQNSQFGIRSEAAHRDLSATTRHNNTYDLPGGAMGSLATRAISLAGYARADKPTLYFNYFLGTAEETATNTTNTMRDSARVLVSADGGTTWELLATNNSQLSTAAILGELPRFISPNIEASTHPRQQVQELFDNTGGWRQARIDLSNYVGLDQLQFRFDFSTAGAMVGINGPQAGDPSIFGNLNDVRRHQVNNGEGFYIDDVIVGFAERGEMTTGPTGNTAFFTIPPNPNPADPAQVLVGNYQLELRRGTEYGDNVDGRNPNIFIFQTFDTNDRLIQSQFRLGDSNLHRDQGQILISSNSITDSLNHGIFVDAGARDAGGSLSRPGGVRNLPTINNPRLTAGTRIENNIIADFGVGGIFFSGDPNTGSLPLSSVPFGRIINNTVYGGNTPRGNGIEVSENASPTILNNVISNTANGLLIDGSSNSTVVGANLFKENSNNGTIGQNAFVLAPSDALFVDPANRNFYPANGSFAVDSSLNLLADRNDFIVVNSPLGIPPAPILAPERDRFGQLRLDDPSQDPPPGLGANVFKDRGAVERADFLGPTARVIVPEDNDGVGQDLNPLANEVLVVPAIISQISIQLQDIGIGIDDLTVLSSKVSVFLDGRRLTAGTDYEFVYDATNNVIILRALTNNGPVSNTYEIFLDNQLGGIRDQAGNLLVPNLQTGVTRFVVVTNGTTAEQTIPDFALSTTRVNALEDNEMELGITRTTIPNFASNLPGPPAIGDPPIVFAIVSITNPTMFSELPAIDLNGTLTFKTAPDRNGNSVVVMRLTETGTSNPRRSGPQTFTISLAPINDAPAFTLPPTLDVFEDQGLVTIANFAAGFGPGPVTAVDEIGQNLTITTLAQLPAAFTVEPTIDNNGTLRFQTRPDFNSLVSQLVVTVQVTDDGPSTPPNVNRSPTKTFTINVIPVNDAPSFRLANSQVTVSEDAEQVAGVPETIIPGFATDIVAGPATATDETTQSLTFTLTAARPELFSQQPTIDANGRLIFKTAPDQSGNTLVFAELRDSGLGAPPPNQNASGRMTFTITINSVNDPPEFTVPATFSSQEDVGPVVHPNFATGIRRGPPTALDESSQQVQFEVLAIDPNAFLAQPEIGVDGTLRFQTAVNANSANADLRVRVRLRDDGLSGPPPNNNLSPYQTFTLNVTAVNDPPVPDAFQVAGIEDTDLTISSATVLVGDASGPTPDEFGQGLTITQVEGATANGGVVVATLSGSTITSMVYRPPLHFVGQDTFRYVVSDDGTPSQSGTGTITVIVAPVNDPPQFNPGSNVVAPEDSGVVSTAWARDILAGPPRAQDELAGPTQQSVTFEVTTNNPSLFASGPTIDSNGLLSFVSSPNAIGSAVVTVTAIDSGPGVSPNVNRSAPVSFTIQIDPVNDAPAFTSGGNVAINEDSGAYDQPWATQIAPAAGLNLTPQQATDESGQTVEFEVQTNAPQLFATLPTIDPAGRLRFTPSTNASGNAAVTVRLRDNGSADGLNRNISDPQTFTITVISTNDDPSGTDDRFEGNEDVVLQIGAPGVLANDNDIDLPGDQLTVVLVNPTSALGAPVVLNADGSFTYDPRNVRSLQAMVEGQSQSDSFTYRVRDAAGALSNVTTVSITVRGVNDAPVAAADRFAIAANQTITLTVLSNDTDVDTPIDDRTIEIRRLAVNGTARALSTGRIEYIPNPGFRGEDTFTYRVRDSLGLLSNEAEVTIRTNAAPVAVPDAATTPAGVPVTINVLANDFDSDGTINASTVSIVIAPSAGTAIVNAAGAIEYTPAANFTGQATLSYTVRDNEGVESNVAAVNIRVSSSAYQNPNNNLDVNADGFISAIDALLIINDLNRSGSRALPPGSFTPPPFIDVNGSASVEPLDALLVINHLNRPGNGEGEGHDETALTLPIMAFPIDVSPLSPRAIADLESQARVRQAIVQLSQGPSVAASASASSRPASVGSFDYDWMDEAAGLLGCDDCDSDAMAEDWNSAFGAEDWLD